MAPGRPKEWTAERIARLGFLVGIGWDGNRIADEFATTPNNVYRQASKLSLSFRERVRVARFDAFSEAAQKRGIAYHSLVDRLLDEIERCPVLIDNILDDQSEMVA